MHVVTFVVRVDLAETDVYIYVHVIIYPHQSAVNTTYWADAVPDNVHLLLFSVEVRSQRRWLEHCYEGEEAEDGLGLDGMGGDPHWKGLEWNN